MSACNGKNCVECREERRQTHEEILNHLNGNLTFSKSEPIRYTEKFNEAFRTRKHKRLLKNSEIAKKLGKMRQVLEHGLFHEDRVSRRHQPQEETRSEFGIRKPILTKKELHEMIKRRKRK